MSRTIKIAVPTDNKETISEHFGRTKYFAVYELKDGKIASKQILENAFQSHERGEHGGLLNVLKDFDEIVCYNMGMRMQMDLQKLNVAVSLTSKSKLSDIIQERLNRTH